MKISFKIFLHVKRVCCIWTLHLDWKLSTLLIWVGFYKYKVVLILQRNWTCWLGIESVSHTQNDFPQRNCLHTSDQFYDLRRAKFYYQVLFASKWAILFCYTFKRPNLKHVSVDKRCSIFFWKLFKMYRRIYINWTR